MLKRDLDALASRTFDVIVLGGGIGGASIAYEAAQRGLSVAILDRGDFGAATTAGNFKTLHGGLRYLQHFDLPRLYESVAEQRFFLASAPELCRPVPFFVPCYGYGMKSKELLEIAMFLYRVLTPFRNEGLLASHRFGAPYSVTKTQALQLAPHLPQKDLRGGVVFYDAMMTNADRVTLAFVESAVAAGAVAANYVEAISGEGTKDATEKYQLHAVEVRDRVTDRKLTVRTRSVINACGPWCDRVSALLVRKAANSARVIPQRIFSKGLQCVLPEIFPKHAVAIESRYADQTANVSRGNRSYFFLPWNDVTLLGTADIVHLDGPDELRFEPEEVSEFVAEAHRSYPDSRIALDAVELVFGGLRPVDASVERRFREGRVTQSGTIETRRRDYIEFDDICGNLLVVEGIKYTTARKVAERAVDKLKAVFPAILPSRSQSTPLRAFARPSQRVVASDSSDEASTDLTPSLSVADIRAAVRYEMACEFEDLFCRRTDLATRGFPGRTVTMRALDEMAKELEWSDEEKRNQLTRTLLSLAKRVYRPEKRKEIEAILRKM